MYYVLSRDAEGNVLEWLEKFGAHWWHGQVVNLEEGLLELNQVSQEFVEGVLYVLEEV